MKQSSATGSPAGLRGRLFAGAALLRSVVLETVYPVEALCLSCGAVVRQGCLCGRCRAQLCGAPSPAASVVSGTPLSGLHPDDRAFRNPDVSSPAASVVSGTPLSGLHPDDWAFRDLDGVPAFSLRPHRGPARALVLALKHRAAACAAEELASLLLPLPPPLALPPHTVVTWVPMPVRRRRQRCIDHSRTLAEAFARRLGLPCRPLLIRARGFSRTQASLGRRSREHNLRRAFLPAGPVTVPVLLVDDVLTTGTTARRCIQALRSAGARDISVLTATHA